MGQRSISFDAGKREKPGSWPGFFTLDGAFECGLITRHSNGEEKLLMSESLEAIFQHVIWNFCYLSVLLGLSAFGIHRYFIIYLFLKNRRKADRAGA